MVSQPEFISMLGINVERSLLLAYTQIRAHQYTRLCHPLPYYCSGQVNWDTSKLLTQKNMYPELGRRRLTQKAFETTKIIFLVFMISLIDTILEINSRCILHS